MTEPEDLVRSTTRAIAGTVRDVPPRRGTRPVHGLCSPSPACGGRHASGPARAARQKMQRMRQVAAARQFQNSSRIIPEVRT